MPRDLLTCFDPNSSRSTNFFASEVVPNAARRDLSIGAESKKFPADFDYDLSRRSQGMTPDAVEAELKKSNYLQKWVD